MDNSNIAFSHAIDIIIWSDRSFGEGIRGTRGYPEVSRYRYITPYVIVSSLHSNATLNITLEGRYGRRIQPETLEVRDSWVPIFTFPQISATGVYRQTPFEIFEVEIRYRMEATISGMIHPPDGPIVTMTLGNILKT